MLTTKKSRATWRPRLGTPTPERTESLVREAIAHEQKRRAEKAEAECQLLREKLQKAMEAKTELDKETNEILAIHIRQRERARKVAQEAMRMLRMRLHVQMAATLCCYFCGAYQDDPHSENCEYVSLWEQFDRLLEV